MWERSHHFKRGEMTVWKPKPKPKKKLHHQPKITGNHQPELDATNSLLSCPSRAFSFLPNKRPIEDLIPFFLGALCRESWLLLTLPRPMLSGSREAGKLL